MQAKSSLHQAALSYAEAGIPIFPCLPDLKKPATEHGFHDATTDAAQIDAWWGEADYNIAFSPHDVGWGVIDPDGPEGAKALEELQETYGQFPETYTVATPSGGQHLYFEGELPTTAWAPGRKRCLGKHIDTRGDGSYALLPPSTFKGKPYVVLRDAALAPVPEWVRAILHRPDQRTEAATAELDSSTNVDRARTFLRDCVERGFVAVQGQGGNNRTYQLACDVLNLGLSLPTALETIEEIWNPACVPPWDAEELEVVVTHAAEYAQNQQGAWGVAAPEETFAAALDQLQAIEPPAPRLSRFHPYSVAEQEAGPDEDTQWLIPDLIPDRETVLLNGSKGSFKSFITHHLGLGISSGISTLGVTPLRSGPFFYATHEGFNDMKKRRRRAWEMIHQPVAGYPFYLMHAPHIINDEECAAFREQIRLILRTPGCKKIAGIALDTLAKCMAGMEENSAQDAGRAVAFCDSLRDEFECPIIVDHHKGLAGGARGRGSSAIEAGFSTILDLDRPNQGRAVELRVRYHKDAEERAEPWTFEAERVLNSIVFYPTTTTEHQQLVHAADLFDARKIGAALASLLAYGASSAVTTHILAAEVAPLTEGMSEEDRASTINRTARTLTGLGRLNGKLEAYCRRIGKDLLWSLPEADPKNDPDPEQ